MSLLKVSPHWWGCVLAGLSVVTVLGIASEVHAADMERAPLPRADFEPARPEVEGLPRADFEHARPENEQRTPADFEAAHPEIEQPPTADFEPSRPEIEH